MPQRRGPGRSWSTGYAAGSIHGTRRSDRSATRSPGLQNQIKTKANFFSRVSWILSALPLPAPAWALLAEVGAAKHKHTELSLAGHCTIKVTERWGRLAVWLALHEPEPLHVLENVLADQHSGRVQAGAHASNGLFHRYAILVNVLLRHACDGCQARSACVPTNAHGWRGRGRGWTAGGGGRGKGRCRQITQISVRTESPAASTRDGVC